MKFLDWFQEKIHKSRFEEDRIENVVEKEGEG